MEKNRFNGKGKKSFLFLIAVLFICFSCKWSIVLYGTLFDKEVFIDSVLQENQDDGVEDEVLPEASEATLEEVEDEITEDFEDEATEGFENFEDEITENIEDMTADNEEDASEHLPTDTLLSEYTSEMVVYSFMDLKVALESSSVTSVYLGDDILMDSVGITINSAKEYLIIDGINPSDPSKTRHSLTDFDANLKVHTILLNKDNGLKSVTLRNIVIYGYNYYGTVCIDDLAKNVITTYENIEYYGPQLAYNRYGTVVLNNALIKIGNFGGKSPAQEVGEVGNVLLKGNINISQVESQINEIFYFPLQSGKIEVFSDAVVNISVYNSSGFLYSPYNVNFIAQYGSEFYYTAPYQFLDLSTTMNNFTVRDYAKVHINITNVKYNGVLLVNDSLYVGKGAQLHLVSNTGLFPVLRIRKKCVFSDPDSVLLYSPGFRPIVYYESGDLDITAQQLNYWTKAGTGGFDDIPLYSWRKVDQTILNLKGAVSLGDLGMFTLQSSNYGDGDVSSPVLPNGSNFNLRNARVIALGRLDISAEYEFLSEGSARIIGSTKPFTEIRLSYTDENSEAVSLYTKADVNGRFNIDLNNTISNGTVIYLKGCCEYLQNETVIVVNEKNLQFEFVPDTMFFPLSEIKSYSEVIKRKERNWNLTVYNSLGAGNEWRLTANIVKDMENSDQFSLPDGSLIFVDEYDNTNVLSIDDEVLIMNHTSVDDVEFVSVSWEDDKGVLLYVEPGTVLVDVVYSATIQWNLVNAP